MAENLTFSELDNENIVKELLEKSLWARQFAYVPYSKFNVGAAMLCENQEGHKKIFYGCNVENGSFGATICAERTAMVKAVSEGYNKLLHIAVTSITDDYTFPCGICRQFLNEFASDNTMLYVYSKENDNVKAYVYRELIPEGFFL